MTRTLEEQGFVKHDGSGMPDCYAKGDMVDLPFEGGEGFYLVQTKAAAAPWKNISLHRRHISERRQLDMAIEALRKIPFLSRTKEQADTLKTLRERQPS